MARRKMPDMNDWRPVWAAIEAQAIKRDGWTRAKLQERTGISPTTFDAMRDRGQPLKRADKIAALLRGLNWAPGSIEAIIGGGQPIMNGRSADSPSRDSGEQADTLNAVHTLQELMLKAAGDVTAALGRLDESVKGLDQRVRALHESRGSG